MITSQNHNGLSQMHWNIDPLFIKIGPFAIHWYGLFFVGGLLGGLYLFRKICKREGRDPDMADDLLLYLIVGILFGARLLHCFVYEPAFYLSHPMEIVKIWKGGLASHGGLIGALVALAIFSRKYRESFLWLLSRLSVVGAFFAVCVRIGNFFNSEILGKSSKLPWAVVFDRIDTLPRHPVQLYEAAAYLLILLLMYLLYEVLSKRASTLLLPGIFFFSIFSARFFLEFFKVRQADYTLPIALSVGQILSIPFILGGLLWILYALYILRKE